MKSAFIRKVLAIVLCVASFAAVSCSSSQDGEYGGEAVVGITQEPSVFDPHTVVAAGDKEILFNIFEGLVKYDHTGELQPCLATDYKIADDAMTYTFTLREGVLFHDGSEMDADDVIYSLNRACELMPNLETVESVTDNGDGTVSINLNSPNSELLPYLTAAIIPEGSGDTIGETIIGTGPFKFESYEPGISVVLSKNENYWNPELPYLDKATFKICADMDAAVLELQAGTVDILPYLTTDKTVGLDEERFTTIAVGSNMVQLLALNNAVEPFTDVRVRQAINYAIDREEIIDIVMNGEALPLVTCMSPVMGFAYDTSLDDMYNQDIENVKLLLEEAGYPDGFDMTITVPSNYLIHVNTAIAIADELSEVGINVTIEQVDWATWLEDVYTNRDYQTTIIALTSDFAPYDVIYRYASDSSKNFINYSNENVDEIITSIPQTASDVDRYDLYHDLLYFIADDAASCYIQDPYATTAYNNRIEGYEIYPMYVQDMSTVKIVDN